MKLNRWMNAMMVLVVAFYSALFIANALVSHEVRAENAAETARLTEMLKHKEQVVQERLQKEPILLGAASYGFLALLLWGIYLDGWIVQRRKRGEPWPERFFEGEKPRWGGRDVLHGFAFLLFVEMCFFWAHQILYAWAGASLEVPDELVFAVSLLRDLVVALFVFLLVKSVYGQSLRDLGLRCERTWTLMRRGALGYVAVLPPLLLTFGILGQILKAFSIEPAPQAIVQTYLSESSSSFLVPLTVFVAILGPMLEEIFFRGFAYAGLRKRFGIWPAACLSSAAFAALHMHWVAFAPIFLLGMFLVYLYERSGSLIPSMTAHVLHNGIMVTLTLLFKHFSA